MLAFGCRWGVAAQARPRALRRQLSSAPALTVGWGRVLRLAARGGVLLLVACGPDWCADTVTQAPSGPSPDPATLTVLVAPAEVTLEFDPTLPPGSRSVSFSLQAFARDPEGNTVIPSAGDLTWTLPSGVTLVQGGEVATFKVAESVTMPLEVTLTVAGAPTTGKAILRRAAAAGGDVVIGTHAPETLAEVLVAAGARSGQCEETVTAFVWRGAVADLQPGAPASCRDEAMILSSHASPGRWSPAGWTATADMLNAQNVAGPPVPPAPAARLVLKPHVYIGVTAWLCNQGTIIPGCSEANQQQWARMTVQDQVDYANTVFERNRVGVQLSLVPERVVNETELENVRTCEAARAWLLADVARVPASGQLTIMWLNALDPVNGSPPRAVACPDLDLDGAPGADADRKLILVSSPDQWMTSTLVHEVGHAFGLRAPQHGHTRLLGMAEQPLDGFGFDNIMAETSTLQFPRIRFTLGQVFRMNADARSLLVTAGLRSGGVDCGCNPLATKVCPSLGRDIAPMERPVTWAGSCVAP